MSYLINPFIFGGVELPTGASHNWEFDNATTVVDTIGTRDLTVTGATLSAFGLTLDGVDDYVQRDSSDALNGEMTYADSWTLTMVLRPSYEATSIHHWFTHRDQDNASVLSRVGIQVRDETDLTAYVEDTNGTTGGVVAIRTVDFLQYVKRLIMYTIRFDATSDTLTVDVNDEGTPPAIANNSFRSGGNALTFGATRNGGGASPIAIARATFWPRHLTDNEVRNELFPFMNSFVASRGFTLQPSTYQEDFSNATVAGGTPTGWTQQWNANNNWDVASNVSAVGGKELVHDGGGAADALEGLSFDAANSDSGRANGEILAMFRMTVASTSSIAQARLVARGSGTAGSENNIEAALFAGGTYLQERNSGVTTSRGSAASPAWGAGDNVMVRFRFADNVIAARSWVPANPADPLADEPTTWTVTSTAVTLTGAGWLGVLEFENSETVVWEWITFATDGGKAPLIGT